MGLEDLQFVPNILSFALAFFLPGFVVIWYFKKNHSKQYKKLFGITVINKATTETFWVLVAGFAANYLSFFIIDFLPRLFGQYTGSNDPRALPWKHVATVLFISLLFALTFAFGKVWSVISGKINVWAKSYKKANPKFHEKLRELIDELLCFREIAAVVKNIAKPVANVALFWSLIFLLIFGAIFFDYSNQSAAAILPQTSSIYINVTPEKNVTFLVNNFEQNAISVAGVYANCSTQNYLNTQNQFHNDWEIRLKPGFIATILEPLDTKLVNVGIFPENCDKTNKYWITIISRDAKEYVCNGHTAKGQLAQCNATSISIPS